MPWKPFTENHVLARLAAREIELYEAVSTAEDDPDAPPTTPKPRIGEIVSQVLGQFVGAIQANPLVSYIGPDGTLPDSCIAHAAVIGRTALIGMLPLSEGMTDIRRDEYRAADTFLKAIPTAPPGLFSQPVGGSAPASSAPAYGGSPLLEF